MFEGLYITTDVNRIIDGAWDFPFEELDYLMEEYDGSVWVLLNGRLYEAS